MTAPILYIVSDMKTVPDGDHYAVITTTTQHTSRLSAEARFHTALASAANNTKFPRWSAVLMTSEGVFLNSACYVPDIQPEPEPEE